MASDVSSIGGKTVMRSLENKNLPVDNVNVKETRFLGGSRKDVITKTATSV